MCITCGCGTDSAHIVTEGHHNHDHGHNHDHNHDHHHHEHGHTHSHHQDVNGRLITLEKDILHENALLAARNRGYLDAKKIFAINMVSSPGSGKTMLLERTLTELKNKIDFSVIEGDQNTSLDADRIRETGTKAVQINTGKGCHLDAHMVLHAIQELDPPERSILFIENVGNLVCPSMFDLGENERVVIFSVTEGDDKPIKYPDMFHTSGVCVINKTDLLPYVSFNVETAMENAKKINPELTFFTTSCTTGEGLDEWYHWLRTKIHKPVAG
ncbi:MAG: hydrogenase accessory protein HypB [Balneolaceae bacterium]|nr:MAG: hydrogenase accessory protein HypB [Balneolaceae bacterium]